MLSGFNGVSETLAEVRPPLTFTKDKPARLSSNENPFGPSEKVRMAMQKAFDNGCRYPNSFANELMEMIAAKEGVTTDHIVLTGGSTEGLKIAGLTYGIEGGEIIAAQPTFLSMMNYAEMFGASVNWVPVGEDMGLDLEEMNRRISYRTRMIFLCNPNNPTSTVLQADQLQDFCRSVSKRVMVFSDEAYYDFIEEKDYPSMISLVKEGQHVIVSRTFSKVYGLAGLRIGYLVARPDIARVLQQRVVAYTNILAIAAATEALKDDEFYDFSVAKNREGKKIIYSALDELNLNYVKSHTNFVFFQSGRPIRSLITEMRDEGVQIGRPFPPFMDWCRISTGTIDEVKLFTSSLKKVLG